MYLICDYKDNIVEVCQRSVWIKRQTNGVDVLCDEADATALYSDDTDTYYPAGKAPTSGVAYRVVEVESVPAGVGKGWKYEGGKFTRAAYIPTAAESAQAIAKLSLAAITDEDTKLKVSGLYPDWAPGSHDVGEIYNTHQGGSLGSEWEQTWECVQTYDNAVYPDLRPGDPSWYTFNRPLHGKSPETARPWVQPTHGTVDIYKVGEYMVWTDGDIYTPTRDTNYSPEEYAPDWTNWTAQQGGGNVEPEPEKPDPEEPEEPSQYPAWEDMAVGAALNAGDYFTYQGVVYRVLRALTVTPGWEPPALLNDYYEEVAAE